MFPGISYALQMALNSGAAHTIILWRNKGVLGEWRLLKKSNKLDPGYQHQLPGAMKKSLAAGMPPSSYKDVFTAYFFVALGNCC
jgi:hypothetical protein